MKNIKGFTLIELLIVIGIIAILASGVIVAINPGQQFEQARNSTRWQHMNTIANAVYSYSVEDQGNFPSCITTTASDLEDCSGDLTPTYINELPKDPSEGGEDNTDCGATEPTDCTGYLISTNAEGTTITIESIAQEAIDAGVTLTK